MLPYFSSNKSNKTIFINPNFRGILPTPEADVSMQSQSVIPKNAHINPLFLEAHKSRHTIHMNPAFLQKIQERQQLQLQAHEEKEAIKRNSLPECPNNLLTHKANGIATNCPGEQSETTETRKIICKSKNRLIREPLKKPDCQHLKLSKPSIPLSPLLVLSKRKLIRKVSAAPVPFKKSETECCDDSNARITKYKLDNRVVRKKALLPPTPKIKRTSYVGRYALRRTSSSQSSSTLARKSIAINKNANKKLQVLNINGLLYKSTQNSLKLKNIVTVRPCNNPILKSSKATSCIKNTNNNLKAVQGLTIFVRGTKYVMDANKFKLTRVTNSDNAATNIMANNKCSQAPTRQRIDIGGYTYISLNSAKNVLIRTTNHLSRAYVHNAKQKSLQMLTKRLVKTNIPCPIFQRIGKCAAFERGKCSKVHNKLQVTICSKFLRGECLNTNCLLSHNISLSKMPVCKFFLQGVCVRNDCPYLHKKLSNKAELCTEFLRGFCQLADKCNKRHEFVCPEIERNNICTTKNCIYCKAKRRKESKIEKKLEVLQSKDANLKLSLASSSAEVTENPSSNRYFIEPCDKTFKDIKESKAQFTNEGNANNIETNMEESLVENVEPSRKTRPKLGVLPSYIPL
ncbi:zinc finger CCCH domain-containing protein 3 [Calliphora vicina]|uniref:zinc finger CCCH domain-containing protein 3 n=1 Tax=Calliphora vicina TaxID=7373 RepID=UPI00325C1136